MALALMGVMAFAVMEVMALAAMGVMAFGFGILPMPVQKGIFTGSPLQDVIAPSAQKDISPVTAKKPIITLSA